MDMEGLIIKDFKVVQWSWDNQNIYFIHEDFNVYIED